VVASGGLTETVGTGKASYTAGEAVYMATRVMKNGVPVSGASVAFTALKPDKVNKVVLKATTNSNGYAYASFRSGADTGSLGTYQLTAAATSGSLTAKASTTFAVSKPGLTETVGTGKAKYKAGEAVYMSARVMKNGAPVSGASVHFSALKPNKINTVDMKATTDSRGYAHASFRSGTGSSSIGAYQLTATATSGSLTAKASTSFSVSN
jgi:hypothetical protein